ncbi:TPA: type II toxin-antitoxin system HicA family toxin [Escherichia coli]
MNTLSAKHKKTLQAVFSMPTPVTLEWRKIEALFIALGAIATEGNGSRVRFEINQVVASFHRPHPEKEAKAYQVRDARTFLEAVGVTP